MKKIKEINKLSITEFNNLLGRTTYEKIINILKPIIVFLTLWLTLDKFMGLSDRISSYPYVLWLLSSVVPALYMYDVLNRSLSDKKKDSTIINTSAFIMFTIMIYITIVIFRLFGFWIDIYYLQIPFYMLLSFIFLGLCSKILTSLSKINNKFNDLKIFIIPLICFSGLFFNTNNISNHYLRKLLRLDPITYLINGFRNSFVKKIWFFEEPKKLLYFIIICLFMLIISLFINKITKKK